MRMRVRSLALLWCRLQTQLRSHVAVVSASSCSSSLTPSPGPSIHRGCDPKKQKKKKKKEKKAGRGDWSLMVVGGGGRSEGSPTRARSWWSELFVGAKGGGAKLCDHLQLWDKRDR